MNVDLDDDQRTLVESFTALFTDTCPPARVRDAEPVGFDAALWRRVRETGAVQMAVEESHGGWGATLLDLALVAEIHGRFLAPTPLIESQVTARLLARLAGTSPRAATALAAALAGEQTVTCAVHPVRDGLAPLVLAGAVADAAVVRDGDRLLLVSCDSGARVENLGSMPVADIAVTPEAEVLAAGEPALAAHTRALDELMVLTAAAQVGIASRSLEIALEYVGQRQAFGVAIGSFQTIAHALADTATAVDGARLLAYEAAWADTEDPDRFSELAAMSFGLATDTARDASYKSLHFHGGYGFTDEYDIQLYYRRARAWSAVVCEPRAAYRRAADRRLATSPDTHPATTLEEPWTSA